MKLLPFSLSKRLVVGASLLTAVAGAGTYGVSNSPWRSDKTAPGETSPAVAADPSPVQPIALPGGDGAPARAAVPNDPTDRFMSIPSAGKERPTSSGLRFDPQVALSSANGEDSPRGAIRTADATTPEPPGLDRRAFVVPGAVAENRTPDAPAATVSAADLEPPARTETPSPSPPSPGGPLLAPPAELDNGLRAAARAAISSAAPDPAPAEGPAVKTPAPDSARLTPPAFDSPQQLAAPAALQPPAGLEAPPRSGASTLSINTGTPSPGSASFDRKPAPEPERSAPALRLPAQLGRDAGTASPNVGPSTGTPGSEELDGLQTPTLTLEKSAPAEIQVGKEAAFQMKVRNIGRVAAHGVTVTDRVPKGTRLVSAQPASTEGPDGQLLWQLGTMQPGDEIAVLMRLLPLEEGEIGSVAQVQFQTHASVRTVCTKPQLTLQHTGPQRVLIGEAVTFEITVTNPGTGAATGVVIEENLPEGLAHAAGNQLEYAVGTLKPGETRRMNLTLKADKPGRIENVLLVRGDGNLIAKDVYPLEVVAPALEVTLDGPKLRYLEREATYDVAVANPGTASAKDIELVTYLPKGMKFVSADHKGKYEAQNHAVYWSLEELPAGQNGVAKLCVLPTETGEQKLRAEGRAAMGLQNASHKTVQVDSLAELQFSVKDAADPIEVGTDTTYAITLTNTGSSASTNIRLAVGLPTQLQPIGGEGPTRVVIEGGQVGIDPLARLAPGEAATYKLRVHGREAGTHRIQVQLVTEETPTPVTREELTRVYADK